MRIAFDVHGTLDADVTVRNFFDLLDSCPEYEVFIISGPPKDEIEKELLQLGIIIDDSRIISVVDFLKYKGVPMEERNGSWWCDEEAWWESKGLICREYHIDIIIDDKIRYKRYMPESTKFMLWIG